MWPSLPTLPGLALGTGSIPAWQGWGPVMPMEVTWHLLSHPSRDFQGSNHITSQFPCTPSLGAGPPQGDLGPRGEGFSPSILHGPATSLPLPSPPCWEWSRSLMEGCRGGTE